MCCPLALGFTMLICLPDVTDDNNDKVGTKYAPDSALRALIGCLYS